MMAMVTFEIKIFENLYSWSDCVLKELKKKLSIYISVTNRHQKAYSIENDKIIEIYEIINEKFFD